MSSLIQRCQAWNCDNIGVEIAIKNLKGPTIYESEQWGAVPANDNYDVEEWLCDKCYKEYKVAMSFG